MQINVAKKWIKQNLQRLQSRFRLEDWQISIVVQKHINDDPESDQLATCQAKSDYQSALIVVGANSIDSIRQLEGVMQHEMLHCVLSPMDQLWDVFAQSDNQAAVNLYNKLHSSASERMVRSLELIMGLGLKSSGIV